MSESNETKSHWFVPEGKFEEFVNKSLANQRLEYENKMLNMRNEVIVLRHEVLSIKEAMLKLSEDYVKLKPILDERKKNQLLRRHIPFTFVPESLKDKNGELIIN